MDASPRSRLTSCVVHTERLTANVVPRPVSLLPHTSLTCLSNSAGLSSIANNFFKLDGDVINVVLRSMRWHELSQSR